MLGIPSALHRPSHLQSGIPALSRAYTELLQAAWGRQSPESQDVPGHSSPGAGHPVHPSEPLLQGQTPTNTHTEGNTTQGYILGGKTKHIPLIVAPDLSTLFLVLFLDVSQ